MWLLAGCGASITVCDETNTCIHTQQYGEPQDFKGALSSFGEEIYNNNEVIKQTDK